MWIAIAAVLSIVIFQVFIVLYLVVVVIRLNERLKEIEKDSFGVAVTTVKDKKRTMWSSRD